MPGRREEKLKQYFVALVPPAPVFDDAQRWKHYFRDQYNSKASLNSPPHITLHMPFRWNEEKEADLTAAFSSFAMGRKPFKVELLNFNAFPPRVIFIDVVPTEPLEALSKDLHRFCKRELNLFNAAYKDQPFHPHLTLAFRDLKKPMFEKAWEEFRERTFTARFEADRISVLKHTGKVWETLRDFYFDGTVATHDDVGRRVELHH